MPILPPPKGRGLLGINIKELKAWLYAHGYYVGNYKVADALRTLADE